MISVSDKDKVSLTDLERRKDAGEFFREKMEQTIAQSPSCQLNSVSPHRVIAILSHGIHFPAGSNMPLIEQKCDCKVFYFDETDVDIGGGDELKSTRWLLKRSSSAIQFRQRPVEFAEALKKLL